MVGTLIRGRGKARGIELDKGLGEVELPVAAPSPMETGQMGLGVGPERDI